MKSYTINIIGAGNLGKTLGYLFNQHNLALLSGVVNITQQSAQQAIKFMGAGIAYQQISELPHADITFITTADANINACSLQLSKNINLKKGDIIVHCSGAKSSLELDACKQLGCYTASIHPMLSIANPAFNVQHFAETYCAMEGDLEALQVLEKLFTQLHAIPYTISAKHKALYHAAGVFASNYLIALAQEAKLCLQQSNVNEELIIPIITNIMQKTISQLQHTNSISDVLTGPIKRGDLTTIKNHLAAFTNPQQHNIYTTLGLAALKLAGLSKEKELTILNMLEQN
jgi:predicted short-subunit dehydrogenase-like oxidoreductase (DUF2520 family)